MDKYYSPKELAKMLSVSHRTVLKLIKSGKLRALNVGAGERPIYKILDGEYQRFIREEYLKYESD